MWGSQHRLTPQDVPGWFFGLKSIRLQWIWMKLGGELSLRTSRICLRRVLDIQQDQNPCSNMLLMIFRGVLGSL